MRVTGGVRLFDADPDLLGDLPAQERAPAREVVVPGVRIAPGVIADLGVGRPRWGVLVLRGVVAREVTVAGVDALELIGAGDVVVPEPTLDETLDRPVRWTVLEALELAVLDDRVEPLLRRWPQLAGTLLRRSERRSARLVIAQAIAGAVRIDARVIALLWTLAGRWGRVGPDGVVMPIRLTHRTMARLVGARRPSVTTAVTQLSAEGRVTRRPDGSWLLHGTPPADIGMPVVEPMAPARGP